MVNKLFIFGSTGDLVKRKVMKSLEKFKDLEVISLGRKDLSLEEYRSSYCENCSIDFKKRINYLKIDFERSLLSQIDSLLDKKQINYFYIAMPPEFITPLLTNLHKIKLSGFKLKILIEKPFGHSLTEAQKLSAFIKSNNLTKDIFLADHYLFKEQVFNLTPRMFKKLKIVSLEQVGFESRSYYDTVGALKDMVQSHFLNLAFKLVSPNQFKFKIIKFKTSQAKNYSRDLGKPSKTETYLDLTLKLKSGQEIEFVTGKYFDKKESYFEIDKKRFDLTTGPDPYSLMFDHFFKNDSKRFPKIKNAIIAWFIINLIEKNRPANLDFY